MRTRLPWSAAGLVALLLSTLLVLDRSSATFRDTSVSAGNSWAADALQPTGTPTATYSCSLTQRRITVSWSPTSSSWATTYRVLRSVNGGSYGSVTTVPVGTTSWQDTGISGSTSYAYKIRVERTGWSWVSADSAPSNTVATPALCV